MKSRLSRRFTALLLCAALLLAPKPAKAEIPSGGQVAGIAIALVAVGAALGVGIYFLVRKPPHITGCVTSGADGLTLHKESDATTYLLTGDTASIKPGNRIRLSGKKHTGPSSQRTFVVEQVAKDYGPCAAAATP
ncbi:MAG: hypothetical protein JSS95_11145 [Acidobacteria bacterium]|nr:hypothetical protein [Acidobacteriota bacterium]